MKNENNPPYGALIERGRVVNANAQAGIYTVESYDRDGVKTPPITALHGNPYNTGDRVFFFMFNDGTGRIIGKMD